MAHFTQQVTRYTRVDSSGREHVVASHRTEFSDAKDAVGRPLHMCGKMRFLINNKRYKTRTELGLLWNVNRSCVLRETVIFDDHE